MILSTQLFQTMSAALSLLLLNLDSDVLLSIKVLSYVSSVVRTLTFLSVAVIHVGFHSGFPISGVSRHEVKAMYKLHSSDEATNLPRLEGSLVPGMIRPFPIAPLIRR